MAVSGRITRSSTLERGMAPPPLEFTQRACGCGRARPDPWFQVRDTCRTEHPGKGAHQCGYRPLSLDRAPWDEEL